jgi:CHAD domain-containing protein
MRFGLTRKQLTPVPDGHRPSIGPALHQALRTEIQRTLKRLRHLRIRPLDVHQSRVSVKRCRALAKLMLHEPAENRAALDRALRDANRALSAGRDAHVLNDTLRLLVERGKLDLKLKRFSHPPEELKNAAVAASVQLEAALALLPSPTALAGLSAADAVEAMRRVYRAACQRWKRAERSGEDEDYHDVRKDTKALAYQLEWLAELLPLTELREDLVELGKLLGRDHDVVLARVQMDAGAVPLPPETLAALDQIARKLLKKTRRRTRAVQQRCLAESSAAFALRLQNALLESLSGPVPDPARENRRQAEKP